MLIQVFIHSDNVQFQKKSIPTPWKVIGNSLGEGGLKSQILETKYEANLEFPGGRWGAKQKPFCGGCMDIFWNCGIMWKVDPNTMMIV